MNEREGKENDDGRRNKPDYSSLSLSLSLLKPHFFFFFFFFFLIESVIAMGSLLGNWPSHDPHNFSQLRPSDPANPSKIEPATYCATHDRTIPPPNQVISTEATKILLRQFYQQPQDRVRTKRAASEHLTPERECKQLRGSFTDAFPTGTSSD